jgi:hypothetical protein
VYEGVLELGRLPFARAFDISDPARLLTAGLQNILTY